MEPLSLFNGFVRGPVADLGLRRATVVNRNRKLRAGAPSFDRSWAQSPRSNFLLGFPFGPRVTGVPAGRDA
jgi:hypothetical protein